MASKEACGWEIVSLKAIVPHDDTKDSEVRIQRTNPGEGKLVLHLLHSTGGQIEPPKEFPAEPDCTGTEYQLHKGTYALGCKAVVYLYDPKDMTKEKDKKEAEFKHP